jgi:hypothetical protein
VFRPTRDIYILSGLERWGRQRVKYQYIASSADSVWYHWHVIEWSVPLRISGWFFMISCLCISTKEKQQTKVWNPWNFQRSLLRPVQRCMELVGNNNRAQFFVLFQTISSQFFSCKITNISSISTFWYPHSKEWYWSKIKLFLCDTTALL